MPDKEFGCYSVEDFRAISEFASTNESEFGDLRHRMASDPDSLLQHFTPPYFWATYYQIPFFYLVLFQLHSLGLVDQVSALSNEPDPHAAVITSIPRLEPQADIDNAKQILGSLMALRGNIRSIGFYSKSLEELTREVEKRNDKAFFDAVLIDRTILTCPPFADRMALAEYQGDEGFFQNLAKKLKQGAPTKKMRPYVPLRVCLYALELEGCLATLSVQRAYGLFCKELQLYPDAPEGDASRSLVRFIQRWRAERAT